MRIETWCTHEWEYQCENGKKGVATGIYGIFVSPEGREYRREAYWDGDNTYKIRFAPTVAGNWTYEIKGLPEAVQGKFECVPYEGDKALFKHGYLKTETGKPYLCYNDGTPFFWLGDTHWQFATVEKWNESNDDRFESQFRGIVDRRIEQGFTVYQCNFYINMDDELYFIKTEDGYKPNLEFFQNDLDLKMKYLVESGLCIAVGFSWYHEIQKENGLEYFKMAARYLISRYGSYPIVWTLAGEVGGYVKSCRDQLIDAWREVALEIEKWDTYQSLQTVHYTNERPFADYYQNEDWFDFTLNQSGHGDYQLSHTWFREYREKYPNKPFVEGESMYENILTLEPNGRRNATPDILRRVAYLAVQNGGCGYTYGGQGIWFAQWEEDLTELPQGLHFGKYDPWYKAIDFPGAYQMKYFREFYEQNNWHELRPLSYDRYQMDGGGELVISLNEDELSLLYLPSASADAEMNKVVTYFAGSNCYPICINLPKGKKYEMQWFSPETGVYENAGVIESPESGTWKSPFKPYQTDAILVLTAVEA